MILAVVLALLLSSLAFSVPQVAEAEPDAPGGAADDEIIGAAPDDPTVETTTPAPPPDTTVETTPPTTAASTTPPTTPPPTTPETTPPTPPTTVEQTPDTTAAPTTTVAPDTTVPPDTTDVPDTTVAEPAKAAEPEPAPQAAGPPVYEINGRWVDQPPSISRGNPVVAEWRVNVNDSGEPPSNDPVNNVTVDFTLDKAIFDEIPDMCLTETADPPVDPPSSISEDGMTLTCNLGTVRMGTAVVVQTPVVATGITGEEVIHDGTIDGQTVELPPIPISNIFQMDIYYGQNVNAYTWDDIEDPSYVNIDFQWSLRLRKGSDPGPEDVTYRLTLTDLNTSTFTIGEHYRDDMTLTGCTGFDWGRADGHPWSDPTGRLVGQPESKIAPFVDECILAPVAGTTNQFDLTLRGIDYSLLDVPTHDSSVAYDNTGNPLPPDWDYIASGSLYFRAFTDEPGSTALASNSPTYEAPTGQMFVDPAANNTTNKSYTLPGGWAAAWYRPYTGSGGTNWDDTYRVAAGTTVEQLTASNGNVPNAPPDSVFGNCLVFDTDYVDYVDVPPDAPFPEVRGYEYNEEEQRYIDVPLVNPPAIQYYTGGVGDPNDFNCAVGGWTTTKPADVSTVTAVKIEYPYSYYADEGIYGIQLHEFTQIEDDVPVGSNVWMFGSALRGTGEWQGTQQAYDDRMWPTPTPGARYPSTNGRRDIVRIIGAIPYIEKESARSTVVPDVPADFTLRYSANGQGIIPDTVDDYEIVDTLPVGMTYVEDSADPPPTVTMDAQGRQVLTWTLDGVETNVEHELTYQAVVDSSVPPGEALTNTAMSSYAGADSDPVTETVTTTNNGYTIILKTADVEYIPNPMGDGVGTGSWTVLIDSFDPLPQAFTDTIDILPYNGDQRGTSFSGTYSLDDVVVPAGATVYYTEADPATLSDDPSDPDGSNGTAGDPTGNTVGWSTDRPANPTAIRVIGGELPAGGEFSFQVVITTDGAEPQDVYVNRAQARAEHTELVMRTSAPLIVTDYVVEKTSDPPSGSTVQPGDVVTYTVTVTQVGDVPAGAVFTDTLTKVFDDAVYNEDVTADIGTATLDGDVLSWMGDVPVGGTATITYSVTVKDVEALEADGDTHLQNVVWSPGGCLTPGEPGTGCGTEHFAGWYTYSKTSKPKPGSVVQVGDVVTYDVRIVQHGEGAIEGAWIEDDLRAVLDDATWNNDIQANIGEASKDGKTVRWDGDLAPGDVVNLTYSVTVTTDGDFELLNVVTNDDPDRSWCVPAPDQNPDCETIHTLGDYEVMKTSDPEDGSEVEAGDDVTYTVTLTHVGIAPVPDATFEDDLTEVLDDATYNDDAEASAGETSYDEPTLEWTGAMNPGDEVTVTYSVTVNAEGDRHLVNVVTTPGECVPAEGQDEACTTEHFNGAFIYSKTSDPEPGTTVNVGDVVNYTVTIEHIGSAPLDDATIEDELSDVLDDATWNGDAKASAGEISYAGSTLEWTGDLAVDDVVTLTYSVTVTDADAELFNVVTTSDERGLCEDAADGNSGCTTEHPPTADPPPAPPAPPAPPSPVTPRPVPVTG